MPECCDCGSNEPRCGCETLKLLREQIVEDFESGTFCRAKDHDCGACACEELTRLMRRAWVLDCPLCGEPDHYVAEGFVCGEECPLCGFELWDMKPGDVHRHGDGDD